MSDELTRVRKASFRRGVGVGLLVGAALGAGLLWLLRFLIIVGDGSDPIVVDNSKLRTYREEHLPSPGSQHQWLLGDSNAFVEISGDAYYKKGEERIHHPFTAKVAGDSVRFFVRGQKAFEIRRDGGQAYAQPASAQQFDTEDVQHPSHAGKQVRKLKRKGNPQSVHITHVEFDNKKLCLGTGGTPVVIAITASCSSDDSPPEDLHLRIEPDAK